MSKRCPVLQKKVRKRNGALVGRVCPEKSLDPLWSAGKIWRWCFVSKAVSKLGVGEFSTGQTRLER